MVCIHFFHEKYLTPHHRVCTNCGKLTFWRPGPGGPLNIDWKDVTDADKTYVGIPISIRQPLTIEGFFAEADALGKYLKQKEMDDENLEKARKVKQEEDRLKIKSLLLVRAIN